MSFCKFYFKFKFSTMPFTFSDPNWKKCLHTMRRFKFTQPIHRMTVLFWCFHQKKYLHQSCDICTCNILWDGYFTFLFHSLLLLTANWIIGCLHLRGLHNEVMSLILKFGHDNCYTTNCFREVWNQPNACNILQKYVRRVWSLHDIYH